MDTPVASKQNQPEVKVGIRKDLSHNDSFMRFYNGIVFGIKLYLFYL